MGLLTKALEENEKNKKIKNQLIDVIAACGKTDLKHLMQATGMRKKEITEIAKELKNEGIIDIKGNLPTIRKYIYLGEVKAKPAPKDLIDLLESKGKITVKDAASMLNVSVETISAWSKDLMHEGLIYLKNPRFGQATLIGDDIKIKKFRVLSTISEKRKTQWVIHTKADLLIALLEKEKSMTLNQAINVLETDEQHLLDLVKRLGKIVQVEYPTNPLSNPKIQLVQGITHLIDKAIEGTVINSYEMDADDIEVGVSISTKPEESMPLYHLKTPYIGEATKALLKSFTDEISDEIAISSDDIMDPKRMLELKDRFHEAATDAIRSHLEVGEMDVRILSAVMLHDMFGLGDIELLLHDDWLEEICINTSQYPVTAYHKRHGWVKTNIKVEDERMVYNFASQIGRKVEREITGLSPIMDAHLLEGDRVNATLFPISNFGNTITIRKFSRSPWTVVNYISDDMRTLSPEMAAFLWLCIQYELNIIVGGGTASGKTSMLSSLCSLIQSTQRVLTIEDTREINLPKYLRWNWVPLTTRSPNPEGKGEVSMLDLIVTSLRMRPDRIILGEIRRRQEAEVLFEAMHTGHSVYSTIHADTSENLKRRLIESPLEIPSAEIEALHLIVIVYRDRRLGVRRVFEIAEIMPSSTGDEFELNYLFRWFPRINEFKKVSQSKRVIDELMMHTGMNQDEINKDLAEKEAILKWMEKNKIYSLNAVGEIFDQYYRDPKKLMEKIRK
ncbi:MAG: Flp pilus assembly complex ATPase component TadA [Candidatus Altiarchaeota archaeon]|nr:Flp pilus assembly complex ATPase component TadA [Candidatus Altiarchaeota archaeon]